MKKRSRLAMGVALLASLAISVPPDVAAQAAQTGQRAGEVSRMIPQVKIVHGTEQITGAPNSPVNWGDLVNTQRNGRARIALDDGSVLNVGSDSSLKITQYNPAAQQSQMDLTYGRLRSKVAKITQPDGKFEVHTPVGVAGVVGTDFFLSFENGMMQLIVYEGTVRFCNLAGICVMVTGGLMSTIRGNNQAPDPPSQATPTELADGGSSTEVVGSAAFVAAPLSHLTILGLTLLVIVPAIVVPIVVTHHPGGGVTTTPNPVTTNGGGCSPQNPNAC
jgi:ferric-dicitrate binding protein FerR (iron transport regulator)